MFAIQLWGIVWIDPLITALISNHIIRETWQIIKKTVNILMQSAAPLNYEAIKTEIEKIKKVKNIHHVHTWMSDEKTIYFEAHIRMENMLLSEVVKLPMKSSTCLRKRRDLSLLHCRQRLISVVINSCSNKN